jgi:transposase-like protein
MHCRKKFTPSVVSQLQGWLQQGLSVEEIAGKIGCTPGTLRVRCSQLGISLRKPANGQQSDRRWKSKLTAMRVAALSSKEGERLMLLVPRLTLEHVRRQASSRDLSEAAFIALLLEKIAEDDLYTAVLDDCK